MDTITRAEARAAGQTTYFTGKPCSKGHTAARRVDNWSCVICSAETSRQSQRRRLQRPEVAEANRERALAWQKANPEKYKARQDAWRAKNRERKAQKDREWRKKNAERCKENKSKWQQRNPERHKAVRAAAFNRYRTRALSGGPLFTAADVDFLNQLQKGKCAECHKRRTLTVDHIVPLYRGGSNHRDNLQLLCRSCNSRKGHKDPLAWAQENGRLV